MQVERSRLEFVRANADAIRKKEEDKEMEKREIQDILMYQASGIQDEYERREMA